MADRVLVMHEGRISADIARAEANEERVMSAALGTTPSTRWGGRAGYDTIRYARDADAAAIFGAYKSAAASCGPREEAARARSLVVLVVLVSRHRRSPSRGFLNLQNLRGVLLNVSIIGLLTARV